jgi:hypothetical protein
VSGQVSENHGALRVFIIESGSQVWCRVVLSCLTCLSGTVILLNGNKTLGKSRSPRSITHPWSRSYSFHDVFVVDLLSAKGGQQQD